MKVHELMTPDVQVITPEDTLQEAAETMLALETGVVPVADGGRLVGMITDRDIVVRAMALGRGPDSKVRDFMTADVKYCFDDQEVDDICRNMAEIQVRRLPVIDHDKRLVGIVALGDIATSEAGETAALALSGISQVNAPPLLLLD